MLDVDLRPADCLCGRRPIRSILFDARLVLEVAAAGETRNRSSYQPLEGVAIFGKQIDAVVFSEFGQIHKRSNSIQMIMQSALTTTHFQRKRPLRSNLLHAISEPRDRPLEHRSIVRSDRDSA